MLMDSVRCLIIPMVHKSTIWGIKGDKTSPTILFKISNKGGDKIMLTLEAIQALKPNLCQTHKICVKHISLPLLLGFLADRVDLHVNIDLFYEKNQLSPYLKFA